MGIADKSEKLKLVPKSLAYRWHKPVNNIFPNQNIAQQAKEVFTLKNYSKLPY